MYIAEFCCRMIVLLLLQLLLLLLMLLGIGGVPETPKIILELSDTPKS